MANNITIDDYITTQEAATMLGISRQRVHALVKTNRLEAVRKGRAWLVLKKSVEEFERLPPYGQIKSKDSVDNS